MRVTITPASLGGSIRSIASKSQAHRLLICAAFAKAPTRIVCRELSRDIEATADCLRALGCGIDYADGSFTVRPRMKAIDGAVLDCGESGSTLRFLLPVVCALGVRASIQMHGRLSQRPLSPLWEELERHGAVLTKPREDVIAVERGISGGDYTIAANISSQFISGLLFALPLTAEGGRIVLTGDIESAGYIDMTRQALERFDVVSHWEGNVLSVPGGRPYVGGGDVEVEGDWSNAAFWTVADKLSESTVLCTGLNSDSTQGDRAVAEAAAQIAAGDATIDAKNIPDLVPVLSVLASVSPGSTRFINAGRLRIKESDRIQSTLALLTALGGKGEETPDGLVVHGVQRLSGGSVDSAGDHRIAMSAAVASIACAGPVIVVGAECVSKSYPAFWADFTTLGGQITVEE